MWYIYAVNIQWTMADCLEFKALMDREVMILNISLEGYILSSSEGFCKAIGVEQGELTGQSLAQLFHPDNLPQQYHELWEGLAGAYGWTDEFSMRRSDGSLFWGEANVSPIRNREGVSVGYHAVIHDVTSKKRLEELAVTDELTKLSNRRHFNAIFTRELARARRSKHHVVVAMIDVDHFKKYNDTYGHPQGDQALIMIGDVFRSLLHRPDDYAFRIGGEEFAILFTAPIDQDLSLITQFANQIRLGVLARAFPHVENEPVGMVSISMGLLRITSPEPTQSGGYCEIADAALYEAKSKGRNRVEIQTL
jgi:diguanylate cyclase (GGDEF)-like protein/PAS domain S-box-containing protein